MGYVVPDQPNIPHDQKEIIKSEQVLQETYLTINDLLNDYVFLEREIKTCKRKANRIVDELTAINEVHRVDDIPTKL
jgi:hypothetical protein